MHFAHFVTVKLFFKTQGKANLTVACQRGAKGTRARVRDLRVVEELDVKHIKHISQNCYCVRFSSRTKPTKLEREQMGKIKCRGFICDSLNIMNPKVYYF